MRDRRDTEPLPITHPMLSQELFKIRHTLVTAAFGLGITLIGMSLLVIWCLA